MLRTDILCVGKIKEESVRALIAEYSKRLGAYTTLRIIEVKDEKTPENCSEVEKAKILQTEGERLAAYLEERSCKIILAVEGKQLSSEAFADYIQEQQNLSVSHLQFLIGGSLGLDEKLKQCADLKLSFSKMTYPHQLMRVILLEQIYRAHKIMRKEPYHK
ncbi:MAG: 23S rRNA (pseudouridine(1915)-N(3))-methyltransferase RlmH [Lachnospiraceae bacterium]|nr:23S rRNA (pseudouridine(1915)-N(3))-methyltransferase RlmH [Lachnospiraceae bacterium]